MPARQESCCFTGHRPAKLPWGYNESDPRCVRLKERIADAVLLAYQEGYRHFLCGMAQGCDLYFCEAVLALRERYPEVTVEAAIPCPTQADAWPEAERRRYRAACRVKMLEAQLDRIGPEEFDQLMEQIEAAQAEVYEAGGDVLRLKWKFYS